MPAVPDPAPMQTCADVLAAVGQALPDLGRQLALHADCHTRLNRLFAAFADHTRELVLGGPASEPQLAACLQLAGHLHERGSAEVRTLIENVYLYALHLDGNSYLLARSRVLLSPALLRCQRQMAFNLLP